VQVADSGPGIPSEILGKIFDPFFTTKKLGSGTGLGLSICHSILTNLGGRIEAANRAEGGAVFTVSVPVNDLRA
jgi:C4-dicarboxylate-specific signal transduction histidine kinase